MLFAAFVRRNLSVCVLSVEFGTWNFPFCSVCVVALFVVVTFVVVLSVEKNACSLQPLGAGTFHAACYLQHFGAGTF